MTLMLASVTDPAEAEIAVACGADIIELKDTLTGTLDPAIVQTAAAQVAGRRPTRAFADTLSTQVVSSLAGTGVSAIALSLASDPYAAPRILALKPLASKTDMIGVFFADEQPDFSFITHLAAAGFVGVTLDTRHKGRARLPQLLDIAALADFLRTAQAAGLEAGLAGGLEPPDVERLLQLKPDFLGFRGALCRAGQRETGVDPGAFKVVRDLIPRPVEGNRTTVDLRLLAGRSAPAAADAETDRVFVHDLVLPASIGAYDAERGVLQRVRFNVDLDIRRVPQAAQDMRDVYSYDLIVDAIKLILSRGHVALVEALAEQIAAAVLAHPRVLTARIRVEKLDVIEGRVGIEILRERHTESAKIHRLFPGVADIGSSKAGL